MVNLMNAIAQASAAPVKGPKLDNRRVLAALVDLAIVVAGAVAILFAADALSGDRGDVQGALGAVILGWTLYYYFALESGGGQTLGKKLMKLRVVRADGRPAGMREIAVRTLLRVVDGVGGYIVGLIVMLATGQRRQRLGDLAAGTIVIASAPADAPPPPAEPVAEAPEEVPEAEVAAPDVATPTITLPSRPAAPATIADLATPEAPAMPEMRPFDPPSAEPAEPVAEPLPDVSTPSLQELARDVVAAQAEFEPEPEPETEPVPLPEADDEEFTVKSVETISAIDLVMGGAPEQEPSSEQAQDPDESVSQ